MSPALDESQISRLATSARQLVQRLPQYQPRMQTAKRKTNKELEVEQELIIHAQNLKLFDRLKKMYSLFIFQTIMNMSEDDPKRIEAIRKYSAIYGRFDCKRKPEKPLTLHEVGKTCA